MTPDTTTDAEHLEALEAAFRKLPDLMDGRRIAVACDRERKTVGMWRWRGGILPEPDEADINGGPVWHRDSLRGFLFGSPFARAWRDAALADSRSARVA